MITEQQARRLARKQGRTLQKHRDGTWSLITDGCWVVENGTLADCVRYMTPPSGNHQRVYGQVLGVTIRQDY